MSLEPFAPFPDDLYDNTIGLYRFSDLPNEQGAPEPTWSDTAELESPASVQPGEATFVDGTGRIVIARTYVVFTPTDIMALPRDMIRWRDRRLFAHGPTSDPGGCGVIYKTVCLETD
jgi:hypothetical protein